MSGLCGTDLLALPVRLALMIRRRLTAAGPSQRDRVGHDGQDLGGLSPDFA
jgi:hypothetical protein